MPPPRDPIAEFQRVRIEAQQIRADSIRSRIMAARTFCAIAESEARRIPERARQTLAKIRRSIDEIEGHILEPNHISPTSAGELRDLLSELRARADSVERSL